MARQFGKIYPEDKWWHTPNVCGNMDEKPEDRIRVLISRLSSMDEQRVQNVHFSSDATHLERGHAIIRDIIRTHVHEIEGLDLVVKESDKPNAFDAGSGKWIRPIRNGQEFVDSIDCSEPENQPWLSDIYIAIRAGSSLSEDDLGNSERPSGSSPTGTAKDGTGPAKNAGATIMERETQSWTSGSKSESSSERPATAMETQTLAFILPGMTA